MKKWFLDFQESLTCGNWSKRGGMCLLGLRWCFFQRILTWETLSDSPPTSLQHLIHAIHATPRPTTLVLQNLLLVAVTSPVACTVTSSPGSTVAPSVARQHEGPLQCRPLQDFGRLAVTNDPTSTCPSDGKNQKSHWNSRRSARVCQGVFRGGRLEKYSTCYKVDVLRSTGEPHVYKRFPQERGFS